MTDMFALQNVNFCNFTTRTITEGELRSLNLEFPTTIRVVEEILHHDDRDCVVATSYAIRFSTTDLDKAKAYVADFYEIDDGINYDRGLHIRTAINDVLFNVNQDSPAWDLDHGDEPIF